MLGFKLIYRQGCSVAGTAFPQLFHVLYKNEFEAVLKWLFFGCVPTPFLLALRSGSKGSDWAIAPPKPLKVTFFTIIVYNSENNIRGIRLFFRQLFCHTSVVKYTSSLLPQRSHCETSLPNITKIAPAKLTDWIHPY